MSINASTNYNIRPARGKLAILPISEEQRESGFILPENAKQKPTRGEVIAVGNSTEECPMDVKKGDIVHFQKWGGTEVDCCGAKIMIIKYDDLLCIEN